jgi:hypothetical protein
VTTAVRIRVITSETPARETPTMAVAVLMSEGYAGLLPPHNSFASLLRTRSRGLDELDTIGVDLRDVFLAVGNDGVDKFKKSWQELLEATQGQLDAAT